MVLKKCSVISLALATTALLASCGGGNSSTSSTGNASSGMAQLSVDLADAPVDGASSVMIRVTGLSLHNPKGEDMYYQFCADPVETDSNTISISIPTATDTAESTDSGPTTEETTGDESELDLDEGSDSESDSESEARESGLVEALACVTPEVREIDLLALTGGETKNLLDDVAVPAGFYPWIRLDLDEENPGSIVLNDGLVHDLTIPSANKSGLKIVNGFSATINGANNLLIDFDLRKSIHKAGSNYRLRPTLRLVKLENKAKQRLKGEWAADAMVSCESPMAYIYEGHDVIPDDLGGTLSQPITTAAFKANEDGTRYTYQVDFISYGDYTVAYVCNGEEDLPDTDDDLIFAESTNVTVGD